MASPDTVDLEALLTPIAGANPAGEHLRYAGAYDAIQEARRADDELPQGDWQRETKVSDWPAVLALATDALASKTKDLQIAAWLVEALVKLHGFAGLRDGLRLLRELQERFWDALYPPIEDGDLEGRSGPLEWLSEKLPACMKAVAVTRSRDGLQYSWLQWEDSRAVDNLRRQNPEAAAEALDGGRIGAEQFDKAVLATPRAFYEALWEDLTEAWDDYERLDRVVDDNFGRQAPSLLGIKKALEDCRALVEGIVKKKRELEPDRAAGESLRAGGQSRPAGSALDWASDPQDRTDALHRLAAVANYFRRTEPHSPVSYLVQRAVQWGEMPLEAWLRDVINDQGVLAHVRETLGLKDLKDSGTTEETSTTSS